MGYPEWSKYGDQGKIYQKAGLKLNHADMRLGKFDSRGRFRGFTDSFKVSNYSVSIPSSNTSSYSTSGFRKLEVIPANGNNWFVGQKGYEDYMGNQSVLFGTADYGCGSTTFDASVASSVLENGTLMNDETDIPYGFTVIEQNDEGITLQVTKL